MLPKGFTKTLVFSLLILCNLILVPNHAAGNALRTDNQETADKNAPIVPTSTSGNEWFVSETGTGTDCSQSGPCSLEYCVEEKADSNDTVYVRAGHYVSTDSDDNLLFIQKSLNLIGSCTWEKIGPVYCYPQNNPPSEETSYLDGENTRRVIAVEGPDIDVSIEGFYIYSGNAENRLPNPWNYPGVGGGVYASDLDSLVLKNNYIWSNKASSIELSTDKYSPGGGVYVEDIRELEIQENTFIFNSASARNSYGLGGGLYVTHCGETGIVDVKSNHFHENMVGDETTFSRGAGAFFIFVGNLNLDNNIFEYHNHTIRSDWIDGSALYLAKDVSANSIDHNVFRLNYGNSIVTLTDLTGSLTRNSFWDNDAFYDLYIEHGDQIEIMNNFFGKTYGRAVSSTDELSGVRGGISTIIYICSLCGDPDVDIINNSFALAEYAIQIGDGPIVDIKRNIFSNLTKKLLM
ncbi:MAG: right-handed parallel beta-helix repeat-containing protein [Chloroflexota bacterium]|nr:right-handed parallel beta-helix repeat-containing protein [Chloroflexota bacterium]